MFVFAIAYGGVARVSADDGVAGGGAEASLKMTVDRAVQVLSLGEADARTLTKAARVLILDSSRPGKRDTPDPVVTLLSGDGAEAGKKALIQALVETTLPLHERVADALMGVMASLPAGSEASWSAALGGFEIERIAEDLYDTASSDNAPIAQRRLAILALGEHRQPFAAQLLLELTAASYPVQVRGWAYNALRSLSYQPGMADDQDAWKRWVAKARKMKPAAWQAMLHDNLLRQSREKDKLHALVRDRLIQAQRSLYRATSPEQRPALLTQLLQDPLDPVRALAMDLARQRAEDSGTFGPELRDQLRARFQDATPKIRADAAKLLGQLEDADAADLMADRLSKGLEKDPGVQQSFLAALTQMPRAQALEPAFELLQVQSLRPSAAGLLASSFRAELGEDAFWKKTLQSVRETLKDTPQPRAQVVTLFGLLIPEDDGPGWTRVGQWLGAEDARVREAAARAWAGSSRSLVVLAERSDDPVIRPLALKAIAERGKAEQTLTALTKRPPTEVDDNLLWRQAMIALAGRVPADALLDSVGQLAEQSNGQTRQVREQMLTAAIERQDKPGEPTRDDLLLLISRGQTRVLADAPALVVIDYEAALKHGDKLTTDQRTEARAALIGAYVADNRVKDALALATKALKTEGELIDDAAASPLIDALVAAAQAAVQRESKEDAGALVAGVRTLLGEAITDARNAELAKLQEAIDQEPEVPVEPES